MLCSGWSCIVITLTNIFVDIYVIDIKYKSNNYNSKLIYKIARTLKNIIQWVTYTLIKLNIIFDLRLFIPIVIIIVNFKIIYLIIFINKIKYNSRFNVTFNYL